MRAPLAMGLGAVFAASLAGMFLPPTTALGAGNLYLQYDRRVMARLKLVVDG